MRRLALGSGLVYDWRMRNLVCAFGLLTLFAAACGPSSKEVATAKAARYQGDKLQLFAATKAAVEGKYTLAKSDETTLGMQTQARWFSPEGLTTSSNPDDERDLPDKSIRISLVVTLLPDGDAWVVNVTPVMLRKNRGMPKPDEVKPGDPSVPGWVDSKVDQLALDIHKALAPYEIKQLGGMAPPPADPATLPPAPDEPSSSAAPAGPDAPAADPSAVPPATDPAEGSATP